jgi:hypothetical protein
MLSGRAMSGLLASLTLPFSAGAASPEAGGALTELHKTAQPILEEYCYDCHGDGTKKGDIAFDELSSKDPAHARKVWLKVLKNVRAGLMPPEKEARPSATEKHALEAWIKTDVFGDDPKNPDPGRVTVRRLNRVEYRNTIRDLMNFDFNVETEFPPDDTGFGFDNIGDVLTVSPMLLEKYLDAAKAIVSKTVPTIGGVPPESVLNGDSFRSNEAVPAGEGQNNSQARSGSSLPYYQPATVTRIFQAAHAGRYQLRVDLSATERYVDNQFDYNKCRLVFKVDGKELLAREFVREGGKGFQFEFDLDWKEGDHELSFELQPILPLSDQVRALAIRLNSVTVRGPLGESHLVRPKNYERFFTRTVPATPEERREYAGELLRNFASKAFRGPVDSGTVDRLVSLAESVSSLPKGTFEGGVAQAMVAVLASPRFLFREEATEPKAPGETYPLLSEYALASRLSYFLWSSMPDAELTRLAGEKKLRENLPAQVKRMLADRRAEALMQNFSGQWLQARDIENVPIQARAVLARDEGPQAAGAGNGGGGRANGGQRGGNRRRAQFSPELRKAMRQETEEYFSYIVREDRSVKEFLASDYTFLNERLAAHYGLNDLNISGDDLRRVVLPENSPRGGILTQGTVLAVTSNPDRTSPVKRGLFILENILGTPPPPPPPDIPSLEDASKGIQDRVPTLRETLAAHREKAACSSCHSRMDPLGLALENFNAMGAFRIQELQQPIDPAGKLLTGESFASVQELKQILATQHYRDFYDTLTEKLLTYALGRGLEYYDMQTIDLIVERMERENGRFSALLMGIIESAPFQRSRAVSEPIVASQSVSPNPISPP